MKLFNFIKNSLGKPNCFVTNLNNGCRCDCFNFAHCGSINPDCEVTELINSKDINSNPLWRMFYDSLILEEKKVFTLVDAANWLSNTYNEKEVTSQTKVRAYGYIIYPLIKRGYINRKARGYFVVSRIEQLEEHDDKEELDEFDLYLLEKSKPSLDMFSDIVEDQE